MLGPALVLVALACRAAVALRALVEPVAVPQGATGEDRARLPAREGHASERDALERPELKALSPECDIEKDVTDPGFTPEQCLQDVAWPRRATRLAKNPSMRFNHVCHGLRYDSWLRENEAKLAGYRQDAQGLRLTRGKALLFLGNSHTGEVYESLLDQLSPRIAKWEVMRFSKSLADGKYYPPSDKLALFPLVPMRYGVDITDATMTGNVSHRPEYSRATLTDGSIIASFVNAGLLYEGPNGWRKILTYLGLAPWDLHGVVLGKRNDVKWAWKHGAIRRDARTHSFEPREVMEFLKSQGYTGRTLLWDNFGIRVSQREQARRANASNANAVDLDDTSSVFPAPCFVPECINTHSNSNPNAHPCNPGPPAAVSAAIPKLLGKY